MKDADDTQLHAYVDCLLDAGSRAAVEQRLARDVDAARRVELWSRQRAELKQLHRHLLHAPVPPELTQAARGMLGRDEARGQLLRFGGIAGALLLAVAMGWTANARWGARQPRAGIDFARQAAIAHAIFAPEVRHPVEVQASEREHLVKWLSKRLQRPIKIPDLQAQGFQLLGGRLLPGAAGPRAQFMYENTAGERVTLYMGLVISGSRETALRYAEDRGVASFYWTDQGFGHAITGTATRPRLLELAESVYRQV